MDAGLEVVAEYDHRIGENPLWHPDDARLYWCSIYDGHLYRYDPSEDSHERVHEGEVIGGFTLEADGSLLLFLAHGAVRRWREGEGIVETVVPPGGTPDARFNDVVADPRGRVFCGTYPQDGRPGALYRLDRDGSLTSLVEGVQLSNGLDFDLECEHLYYAESNAHRIHRFAYDEATGALTGRETFVRVEEDAGIPDGLTVDSEGYVWSARAHAGFVVRYAPDGTEVSRIDFPTPVVTSVAFGGPDLGDLYVTTGGGEDKRANGPDAGALFRCRPGVTGRATFRSAIDGG